ncbi:MAG TPA: hypothetical protein VGQ46_22220 [Thermoanaerobaculia bacterium]|jgi:hypothetical protein|nr:hypothetical protein [Thermoanaerobaculia bacterium]
MNSEDPKSGDPNAGDPKGADPKSGDSKNGESKGETPKLVKEVNERTRASLILGSAVAVVFALWVLSAWMTQFFDPWLQLPFLIVAGLISLLGVAAALTVIFKTVHANQQSPRLPLPCNDDVPAIRAALVVVGTIVIVFGLLAGAAFAMKAANLTDDAVRLPLLVIAGLVSLIALLAVMAIAFKTVSLADKTQALGLPDGTVRAVIALSLILIFAVVTVYLFSDLSDPERITRPMLDSAGKPVLDSARHQVTETVPEPPARPLMDTTPRPRLDTAGAPMVDAAGKPMMDTSARPVLDSAGKPVVEPPSPEETRRASKLAASQDFAKQLLIMLGTLITSITSFYFASKTASDAGGSPTASTPKLTGVDRPSLLLADLPASLVGQGTGLQPTQQVTLRSAKGEVAATAVSSNDTTVHFVVPTGTAAEKWDVVVKMVDGTLATLPAAITIT